MIKGIDEFLGGFHARPARLSAVGVKCILGFNVYHKMHFKATPWKCLLTIDYWN